MSLKTVNAYESINMIIRPLVRNGSLNKLNPSNLKSLGLELINFDIYSTKYRIDKQEARTDLKVKIVM